MHLFNLRKSTSSLQTLIGNGTPQRYHPWYSDEGLLNKMKTCVSQLLEVKSALSPETTTLKQLNKTLEATWVHGFKVQQRQSSMNSFKEQLKEIPRLVALLLLSLPPDENIYYLLLRHVKECNETFGSEFLSNLFLKAHPQGIQETKKFIVAQYQRRGFPTSELQKKIRLVLPKINIRKK
jgi:hypothetical protein